MTIQLGVPGAAGGGGGGGTPYDGGEVSSAIQTPGLQIGDDYDVQFAASPRANGGPIFPHFQNVATDQAGAVLNLMAFAADNQDSPALILTKSAALVPGDNEILENAEAIGYIIFAADDGTNYLTVPARIRGRVDDAAPAASSIGGELLFDVQRGLAANDITNVLRLASDLNAHFAGAILLPGNIVSTGIQLSISNATSPNILLQRTGGADLILQAVGTTHALVGPSTADELRLQTSNTERVIIEADGDMRVLEALAHEGSTVGFFGVTPFARRPAYTLTNVTEDRAFNADTVAIAELADIVGTVINDLILYGLLEHTGGG